MTFATAKFRSFLPAATFAMLTEFLLGLADMVIAGNVLGEEALSAVNLMQPVLNAVSFLALLVGTGASVLFATAIGGFQERRAHEMFTQGLLSALGLGGLLMVALACARGPVLALLGAAPAVTAGANAFWLWFLPCAVLEPLAFLLVNMCYADGDARLGFFAYGAQLVVKVSVSVPCTMAFGLAGCAFGTVLGNLAALAVLCGHFFRKGCNLRLVRHFSLRDTFRICWCAAGDAALKLCYAILFFLLNAYVIARFGSDRLPVLAVVTTVMGIAEAFDGVATAVQPLASVYIGERNDVRTRSVMTAAVKVVLAEGLLAALFLLAAPELAVRLVGIDDPALAASTRTAVRFVAPGLVATALMMLFNSYYMYIAREGLAAALTVFTTLVAPAALFPALGAALGADGVWLALGLAPAAAVLALSAFIAWKWGPARFPFLLDPGRAGKIRVFDLAVDPVGVCAASAAVGAQLRACGQSAARAAKASLLVEETLMTVRERNAGRRVRAEVTVDTNDALVLTLRDDGVLFDITDADQSVSSLRTYLVSNLMTAIPVRRNLTTTGFNRNVFKL